MSAAAGPSLNTRCCVVGGGPAGMMLGLLLARAGVAVTVLEKHADFLRDFRGDTVHPSTLQILREIGLLEAFGRVPQRRVDQLGGIVGGRMQPLIDFRGLRPFDYLALAPQWDFLDLLATEGRRFPSFDLRMRHAATGLLEESGRVAGVHVQGPDGSFTVHADLVVACDGRSSTVRAASGIHSIQYGAPMDVLWFRLTRSQDDPQDTFGIIDGGHMMVLLNRTDYWQVAYLVPKGGDAAQRAQSIEGFARSIAQLAPFLSDRTQALDSWDKVSTLEVRVDRLPQWHRPGLLLIGDAAHAMSPVGGVGINLAIQDAVAAANALAGPLRDGGAIDESLLARIQRRREWPTRVVQTVQRVVQQQVISPALEQRAGPMRVPALLRALLHFQTVRRVPARLFGYGLRQEHVRCGPVR